MAFTDDAAFFERLQFFNGQRLFAEDLQGLEMVNREMRWWHNRSLHQPGIGSGFAVSGQQGDREVSVQPGYAIDANGREIVLTSARILPIPPVAVDESDNPIFYDLTVSYPDNAELEKTEVRQGVCNPAGVVRRREQPVFCWVELQKNTQTGTLQPKKSATLKNNLKNGLRIVLARVEIVNCQLKQAVSIQQRQSARPASLPYIASGTSEKITLEFETSQTETPLRSVKFNSNEPLIIQYPLIANVVTASAGFITTPHYSAQIVGERFFEKKIENKYSCIIDALLNIVKPTATTFKMKAWLIVQLLDPITQDIEIEPDKFKEIIADWQIAWMGVES